MKDASFDPVYKKWTVEELEEVRATKLFYERWAERRGELREAARWRKKRLEIEAAIRWHKQQKGMR
jgi:hypothetical protein